MRARNELRAEAEAAGHTAASVCYVCRLVWSILCLGACTYVVFWLGQSGWWYLLAIFLCSGGCRPYRSAEQIKADGK